MLNILHVKLNFYQTVFSLTFGIVLAELTDEYTHDTACLEIALKRSNGKKGKVLIDGIADSQHCYALAKRFNKTLLTPPKTGAVLRKEKVFQERNEAIFNYA